MKKFKIKDAETQEEFEVEEVSDEVEEIKKDDLDLSPEEITALKKLAPIADKLIALLEVENKEHAATEDADEDIVEDEDADDEVADSKEEVIETIKKDSIASFGANEKRTSVSDSLDERELEVEDAWAKRYGGKR